MKEVAANEFDRFRAGPAKYAAYLDTPEGRLRLDLAFANLQDFFPQITTGLRCLDLGGGTGAMAVRLAQLGINVTLLDESVPMLEFAKRAAQQAGVMDRLTLKRGDATHVATLFAAESFDLILCHNVLEYVDQPITVLHGAARALRDPSSIISILARTRAGEVLKSAVRDGDLAAAEQGLTAERGHESLCGGSVRLFTAESLKGMVAAGGALAVAAERGVRVISDYLPQQISRKNDYERIFQLERKLGSRPEFAAIARYSHFLAQRTAPVRKVGA